MPDPFEARFDSLHNLWTKKSIHSEKDLPSTQWLVVECSILFARQVCAC